MGSKKYFKKSSKILKNSNLEELGKKVESAEYITEYVKDKNLYEPHVDFATASNFAKYGLAEKYYEDSIKRIYKTYPYDGSLKEKTQWENESSYLDKWIFRNKYPRTNGYISIGKTWGGLSQMLGAYGAPASASYEYVKIKGGPHVGFEPSGDRDVQSVSGSKGIRYENANVFKASKNRASNLQFDLSGAYTGSSAGVTVEFWLKKDGFDTDYTKKEVIFDLWNQENDNSPSYGRLMIEMSGTGLAGHDRRVAKFDDGCFRLTVQSGTEGAYDVQIGKGALAYTSSVGNNNWNHYAFTFNSSSQPGDSYKSGAETTGSVEAKLFINGELNDHKYLSGSSIQEVTGALIASIGSLQAGPSGSLYNDHDTEMAGYGKLLSSSLDEFRYWKSRRTAEDIGKFYKTQVGGGTNTDDANVTLGVYYKFNEGITGTSSVDSNVLDYSGRLSNGDWTGYSQATTPRSTDSALVESTAVSSEFKDPIIYSFHSNVQDLLGEMKNSGSLHDVQNMSSIYHSIPGWITDEDEKSDGNSLKNLVQIISSYFDNLHVQIEKLTEIRESKYQIKDKPLPFANRLLESAGFIAPEIAADATVLEQFLSRNDERVFDDKLHNIKNLIYQNIYNNLSYIYKSKGTEKAFRNLIRCFGVDDELIKVNLYADGTTYQFKNNFRSSVVRKKCIDFSNTGSYSAVVYQMTASGDSTNTKSFITSSNILYDGLHDADFVPMTVETGIVFPKKHTLSSKYYVQTPFTASSLFGMHTAIASDQADVSWNIGDDYASFQVYALRTNEDDVDIKFKLTSSIGDGVYLTSSMFKDVYQDESWNFAVSLKHSKYPMSDFVSGTVSASEGNYDLEFYGVNMLLDKVREMGNGPQEFLLTASIDNSVGEKFLRSAKRLYIGAHRDNFTGSVLDKSDIKVSYMRYWADYLPTSSIRSHGRDPLNYGVSNPYENAYLGMSRLSNIHVPKIETLALNWDFEQITGSGDDGTFFVEDASSGSNDLANRKYRWLGKVLKYRHTGQGFGFPATFSGSVDGKYMYVAKQQLPEILNSSDMINILPADVEVKTKASRPSKYFFAIEKSMYQNISEEMLKMFSSIADFNNLIGHPVEKYRPEYKKLKNLRQFFFERLQNTPDLDKFIDFYKWLDGAMSEMILQLIPASSKFSEGLRNTVESHVLERNKFEYKFPVLELKPSTEGKVEGMGKRRYPWSTGHHPVSGLESENKLWWMEKASVDEAGSPLSSSLSGTNFSKAQIQGIKRQILTRNDSTPYKDGVNVNSVIKSGINFSTNKNIHYYRPATKRAAEAELAGNAPLNVILSFKKDLVAPRDPYQQLTKDASENPVPGPIDGKDRKEGVYDRSELKYKFIAESQLHTDIVGTGEMFMPFNLYSSSVQTNHNYPVWDGLSDGLEVTNIHHDTYGPDQEEPMQGPFTNAHVGGNAHRHVNINKYSLEKNTESNLDDATSRPEGFKIYLGALAGGGAGGTLGVVGADYSTYLGYPDIHSSPAQHYRDETARRPVNIRNIETMTGSSVLGNYTRKYEIVQTSGRKENNLYFRKNQGISASTAISSWVTGVVDYEVPRHDLSGTKAVFVNRFSAPGGPEVNGRGFLDIEAGEYSAYNALPWRNLSVRRPLKELLSRHAGQFGYDYFYGHPTASNRMASFHKVNRNSGYEISYGGFPSSDSFVTSSKYDNEFITRPIPRSDLQYTWITASAIQAGTAAGPNGNGNNGFSKLPNGVAFGYTTGSLADGIHYEIKFVSGSEVAPGLNPSRNISFAGYSTFIYDPLTSSANILSSAVGDDLYWNTDRVTTPSTAPNHLYSLLLHRNGPYGWPIFKQTRVGQHPVARYHRKNNIISIQDDPRAVRQDRDAGKVDIVVPMRGSKILQYTEPVLGKKHLPMIHEFKVGKTNFKLTHTYGNQLSRFANLDLNKKLLYKKDDKETYDSLRANYRPGGAQEGSLVSFQYRENIFPKEVNTGLQKSRYRILYTEQEGYGTNGYDRGPQDRRSFWNVERTRTGSSNAALDAFGQITERINAWPLGNRYNFTYDVGPSGGQVQSITFNTGTYQGEISPLPLFLGTGSDEALCVLPMAEYNGMMSYITGTLGAGGAYGDHNSYNFRSCSLGFVDAHIDAITPAQNGMVNLYHYPTASLSVAYLPALQSRHAALTQSHPTEYIYPYRIPEQSGKSPWYDSYDEYASDIRYMAKDHTIVPEFKISDHIEHFVEGKGGAFRTTIRDYLRLDGANHSSSAEDKELGFDSDFFKTYSHSDFMEHFGKVKTEHVLDDIIPSKITLICEGIKKLLPYNGFYPVSRTVQLASLLSQSIGPYISGGMDPADVSLSVDRPTQKESLQALSNMFFAPGLMYNAIKSGIAVDYPMLTGSINELLALGGIASHYVVDSGVAPGDGTRDIENLELKEAPNFRMPFEGMVDLKNALPMQKGLTPIPVDKFHFVGSGSTVHPMVDPEGIGRTEGVKVPRFWWNGKKSSLFEMASNNFLAEVPKFFLSQRGMRTFVSAPEKDFKTMKASVKYSMDIRLAKTSKFDMVRSYFSSSLWGNDTIKRSYHGRYFGSPYNYMSSALDDVTSRFSRALYYSDPAYAPYTPPYFYGDAIARISFTPDTTRKYTLDEIFASADIYYHNTAQLSSSIPVHLRNEEDGTEIGIFRKFNPIETHPSASENGMMQLSASVNVVGKTRLKKVMLDAITGQPQSVEDAASTDFDAWVISPKWECPTLNFHDRPPSQPEATGMWATYGVIPSGSEGIYISLEESAKEMSSYGVPAASGEGSLLDVVGFIRGRQRIGELAEKTKLEEAIIAIPFLERANNVNEMVNIEGKNFFAINKRIYHRQKNNLESGKAAVLKDQYRNEKDIEDTSISDLIRAMDKYYFPPFMDFSTFLNPESKKLKKGEEKREAGIDPFVMYMFEFSTEFDKEDLADIWQGVMPKPMMKAEKERAVVTHSSAPWEFFHGKDIPNDIRWMVFKVKQKAEKSYFDMTADQSDDARFKFDFKIGEKRPEYNYNWPYDYCSLVELAKMSANIEFQPSSST